MAFASLWLGIVAVLLIVSWLSVSFRPGFLTTAYLWLTILTSVCCFVAYGIDKRRAVRDKRRISERMLHVLAFAGGWPGALLAQQVFRHKTLKIRFRFVLWIIIAIHLSAIGYCIYSVVDRRVSPSEQVAGALYWSESPRIPISTSRMTPQLSYIASEHRRVAVSRVLKCCEVSECCDSRYAFSLS